jgi:hypothetical protein
MEKTQDLALDTSIITESELNFVDLVIFKLIEKKKFNSKKSTKKKFFLSNIK